MTVPKARARRQRIRLVLTDGQRTDDIFWLEHRGRGVIYGPTGLDRAHFTYAGHGRRHFTARDGTDNDFGYDEPLAQFRVQRILMTLPLAAGMHPHSRPYHAGKRETAIFIDVRSLARGGAALVGLVEPGRLDALQGIGEVHRPVYGSVRKFTVLTQVVPWV